jgi:hypothetical protein
METKTKGSYATAISIPLDAGNAALFATDSALMGAKTALTDLDDVHLFLRDLLRRVEQFELTQDVAVEDLFTPRFVHAYSAFDSFDQMVRAAGVAIVHSINELDTNDRWKRFIVDRTRFESWDEMRDEAAREWIANELGLTYSDRGITPWLDRTPQWERSDACESCLR